MFSDAVDHVLTDFPAQYDRNDPVDVLLEQRVGTMQRAREQRNRMGGAPPPPPVDAAAAFLDEDGKPELPPALTRRECVSLLLISRLRSLCSSHSLILISEIRFSRPPKMVAKSVRAIKAREIGKLCALRGIVTRVSDVRPRVVVATYTCDQCGCEIYQEVNSRQYTPLSECPSQRCKMNGLHGRLYPQTRGSRFIKFQELKMQEMSEDVPMGHIPRTITVHIMGELTRMCGPGDVVTMTGISFSVSSSSFLSNLLPFPLPSLLLLFHVYLPVPVHGFRAMKQGLVTDTYFEAMQIDKHKRGYNEFVVNEAIAEEIDALHDTGTCFLRCVFLCILMVAFFLFNIRQSFRHTGLLDFSRNLRSFGCKESHLVAAGGWCHSCASRRHAYSW